MKKEIICIVCPMGCFLTVEHNQKKVQSTIGNRCSLGLDYAEKEVLNPEEH